MYILIVLYKFIGIIIISVLVCDNVCYLLPFSFTANFACSTVGRSIPFSSITPMMRCVLPREGSPYPVDTPLLYT